jgi:hypothetical protein
LPEEEVNFAELKGKDGDYEIDLSDLDIKPNHEGVSHQQDRWGPIAALTLTTRDVRVNVQDEADPGEFVLVHESVRKRINDVIAYRPKSLKGVKHKIVKHSGEEEEEGLAGLRDLVQPDKRVA